MKHQEDHKQGVTAIAAKSITLTALVTTLSSSSVA